MKRDRREKIGDVFTRKSEAGEGVRAPGGAVFAKGAERLGVTETDGISQGVERGASLVQASTNFFSSSGMGASTICARAVRSKSQPAGTRS